MAAAPQPKFTAETIKERLNTAGAAVKLAAAFARELDWLGDAASHPQGSDERDLALVRDQVDRALSLLLLDVHATTRHRAESSRSMELLSFVAIGERGDGYDALHLMRRIHELYGDDSNSDGSVTDSTLPDRFAWDTYLRVCALAGLAKECPQHLRFSAGQMHGWPMIVSHHLDTTAEFQAIAERLELGADYPLDVGPRKKRGTETPLLRYLEPLIWRLFVLWGMLIEAANAPKNPVSGNQRRWSPAPIPTDDDGFAQRIHGLWWEFPDPKPGPETVAILRRLIALPPLTKKTAREWSRKVIVPLIMLEDAGMGETCEVPALRNIWQHRAVKSRATFQSRLHSAVTDTLQRFGRPG